MNRIGAGFLAAMIAGASWALVSTGRVDGEPVTKAKTVATREIVGMRRLTEGEYRRSIADAFGPDIKVQGRFEPDVRRDGLIAIGNGQASISSSGMEQYYSMASSIAEQITDETGRRSFVPCRPASPKKADDACTAAFFSKYGRLLYRRPLESDELKGFVATARQAATEARDFYVGLEETFATLLASPAFLFRIERSSGVDVNGLPVLDDFSRASRLSFLFWDAPPDEELLKAAEAGELSTKEGLARQVDRLVASPRLTVGLTAFFDDMLQMNMFRTQTKDAARFPKYSQVLAEDSRQQTLRTLIDLLVTRNGDYRDIFTTRDTFLTRTLAMVYNVPYTSDAAWSPYRFDDRSDRAGVLTQISFLSLFSHPAQSSPTKRGVALNEIFLCTPIPPPPPDVDFSAVNGSGPDRKPTARLRLEQHRTNPACAACHQVMDPPGLALERFDTLGQTRETENGMPIDVRSEINGKTVTGAEGLGQLIHDNPQAPACLVRNLFAAGAGRAPAYYETGRLEKLTDDFAAGAYRLPSFLKTAAKEEAFFALPKPKAGARASVQGKARP